MTTEVKNIKNMEDLKDEFNLSANASVLSDKLNDAYKEPIIVYKKHIGISEKLESSLAEIMNDVVNEYSSSLDVYVLSENAAMSQKKRYEEKQDLHAMSSADEGKDEAIQHFKKIVETGWQHGCSDIYIRVIKDDSMDTTVALFLVKNEIDHSLTYSLPSHDEGMTMLSAFFNFFAKTTNNVDFTVKSKQAASCTLTVKNLQGQEEKVRVRAEKNPTNVDDTEVFCVLRLLSTKLKNFDDLNTPKEVVKVFNRHISADQGFIITSGPTGSGKSTLMLAGLQNWPSNKMLQTMESPVEYIMPKDKFINVIQNSLGEGDDPEQEIKRLLRQKPHGMFMGEMSSKQTAQLGFNFAKTGHLCLATLHANSAIAIPNRLLSMGIEKDDLVSPGVLRLLIAQRLYQRICPHCSTDVPDDSSEYIHASIGAIDLSNAKLRNHKGCDKCSSGIAGMKAYIETVEVGSKDLQFIAKDDHAGWKQSLKHKGVRFIEDLVKTDIESGLLCAESMSRVIASERAADEVFE